SSLEEGLEETLALDRLSVPESLRAHLPSTNSIENVFSRVRSHARNVKNWRSEEMVERWAAPGFSGRRGVSVGSKHTGTSSRSLSLREESLRTTARPGKL
ncbi:MAG: hypothetical protein ACUVXB_18175, partial [Bryobacteraceae bacterium]